MNKYFLYNEEILKLKEEEKKTAPKKKTRHKWKKKIKEILS